MKKILQFFSFLFLFCLMVLSVYLGLRYYLYIQNHSNEKETVFPKDEVASDQQEDVIKTETSFTYEERLERGDYYEENAFLSLALSEYEKAQQIHPELSEPYFKLGKTYMFLGDLEKAQTNLGKALEKEPDNQKFKLTLAKSYLKQNNFQEAKKIFSQIQSTNEEAAFYLAILGLLQNDFENTRKSLETIQNTTQTPQLKEKINNVLNSYTEFNLFQNGQEIHLKTLLAKSFNQIQEYEIALALLKNILKEKTDYRDAWILTGYAYLSLNKYDLALDAFRKAYDLDSEKPETQYFLGLTYFELNQIDEAITYLDIALKNGFEPQIQIKQKLGDIYLEQKDYTEAVVMYEDVLALNSNDVNTFIRPIWIYLDFLNDPDKALELAQKAYKEHPHAAMTFNLLGWSHLAKKEYTKAAEYLEKAVEMDQNLQSAWFNLGQVSEGKGDKTKALELYQKAYEINKTSSIGNLAAQAYNQLESK